MACEATGGARREYRCAAEGCAGIVAVAAVQRGVIEGLCCPVCGLVQSIYFGGYNPGAGRPAGNGDPRNPPIERGPVRPWKRGGR